MTSDVKPIELLRIPDLAGKAVLITGASTGIGAALARAFAQQGSRVALHYNASADAAAEQADLIAAAGGTVHLVHGDMSEPGVSEQVVEDAAKALEGLDGLINNAGGMLGRRPTSDIDDAHYERVMNLNARSVLAATRAAHPHLKARGGGFIINTTSIAARNGGGQGSLIYAASKGFVSTITKGHAREFVGDNIRVNAVSPGLIATPFHERYTAPDVMKAQSATIPMGRAGVAEDCVGAYLFLASPALSSYVTGQIIEVNGGQMMP